MTVIVGVVSAYYSLLNMHYFTYLVCTSVFLFKCVLLLRLFPGIASCFLLLKLHFPCCFAAPWPTMPKRSGCCWKKKKMRSINGRWSGSSSTPPALQVIVLLLGLQILNHQQYSQFWKTTEAQKDILQPSTACRMIFLMNITNKTQSPD